MFRLLIPCLIWLSTVRSDTGMHVPGAGEISAEMGKMADAPMLLKAKRDSIHQPCESPVHPTTHVHAYSASPVYAKPQIQQVYLKKELGVAQSQLQYLQQPAALPTVTYLKPTAPVSYPQQPMQHQVQYFKSAYEKPMLFYTPTVYHESMYRNNYATPKILLKKYETPIVYQKSLMQHHPLTTLQYASPKLTQLHPAPPVYVPAVHDSVIVKPDCV